ncbi:hypothetical protein EBR21_11655, partial [bacterium]|nr:hypothetical protein [bacterium]
GTTTYASGAASTGTSQNVALRLSYADLQAISNAYDTDLTTIYFKLTQLDGGTITMPSGTLHAAVGSITGSDRIVGPGESIVWTPATNASSATGLPAFKFVAYDNAEDSVHTATVSVKVEAVNQAPTMNSAVSYSTARNVAYTISHTSLASLLSLSDSDNATSSLKFRLEDKVSGTLQVKVNGGAAQTANVGDLLASTDEFVWTPNLNVTGSQVAFKVSAQDVAGLRTAAIATVTFSVSGSNIPPKMALNATPTVDISDVELSPAGSQGQSYRISFTSLASLLPIQDADSDGRYYVVTSISGGTLRRGAATVSAQLNAPATAPDAAQNHLLATGEEFLFIPDPATFGSNVEILRVRAWDGQNYSSEAVVRLDLERVYSTPVLTSISDFSGLIQDQVYPFTYDTLRSNAVMSNVDETGANKMWFKVTAVEPSYNQQLTGSLVGSLLEIKPSGAASFTAVTTPLSNVFIKPGDQLRWTPNKGAYGKLYGFKVAAYQDNGTGPAKQSVTDVAVNFSTVKVNSAPKFVNADGNDTTISSAVEDTPYVLNYNQLAANYPGTDLETGALTYQIVNIPSANGVYRKVSAAGTSTLTSGVNAVDLNPGDSILWTPPLNISGVAQNLFEVMLKDADGAFTSSSRMVKINITAVNDAPSYGTPVLKLLGDAGTSKNISGGQTITYANVLAAIPVSDIENDTVDFRIESIGSGVLRKGSTNSGAQILMTSAETMPRLISGTGDGNSTLSTVNWTPPVNATGEFLVMTVRACDATACSPTSREVRVMVNGVNAVPTISSALVGAPGRSAGNVNFVLGTTTYASGAASTGTSQNVALRLSYADLQAISN